MQEMLANALVRSLGVNKVHISERVFECVSRTAMAEDEHEPYIVVLCNR
jgi:hypothetical protein